ncbi:hypothetical protein RSAG8_01604, partial [Rhizoctonia solani AG-8 WAC10335]
MAAVPPQSPPHRKMSLSSDEKSANHTPHAGSEVEGSYDPHAEGVRRIAAISSSFDLKSKFFLFFGVFLVAYAYGLDGQTRYTYQTYATNDYAQHSLLGTFNTVRAICAAAIQPPYARVADRFGRLELILFATTFYVFAVLPDRIHWTYAPHRVLIAGMIVAIGLNMSWYLQGDFLYTVLAVSFDQSVTSATRITSLYSFTSVLVGVGAGLLIRKFRYIKPFVIAGTLVFILAMGLLIKFRDGSAGVHGIIGAQVVLGFGGGLFPYPTQALVQAASSHEQMATMTALYLSFYQIGSALGNAISTAIWTQTLPKKLAEHLGDATAAASAYASPLTYIASYPVGTPERTAMIAAYSDVQRYLAITGLCLSLIVFVSSLFLRNYKVDEKQSLSEDERLGRKAPENLTA